MQGDRTKSTEQFFYLQSISKSKSQVDICGNYIMQAIEDELFKKALSDARNRGVRLKCIIKISKENKIAKIDGTS